MPYRSSGLVPGDQYESPEYLSMCSKVSERTREEGQEGESLRTTPDPGCTKVTQTPEGPGHRSWPPLRAEASRPFPWRTWSELAAERRLDDMDNAGGTHKKKFQATLDSLTEESARIHPPSSLESRCHRENPAAPEDESRKVRVNFRVHYITDSPHQLLAVTGNQQELGAWGGFVPLQRASNGFWENVLCLSTGSRLEWKVVLVEDGRIQRWEEGPNRQLVVSSEGEEIQLGCVCACHRTMLNTACRPVLMS